MFKSSVCVSVYHGTNRWVSLPMCSLARGARCAISSVFLWFVAAVSTLFSPLLKITSERFLVGAVVNVSMENANQKVAEVRSDHEMKPVDL